MIAGAAAPWLGPAVFGPGANGPRLVMIGALGLWTTVNMELMTGLYRVQERPLAYSVRTVATLIANAALTILFLVGLGLGADGMLLGSFLGQAIVYLAVLREQRAWLLPSFDGRLLREMLAFGIPLMPAGAALWLVNLVNRPFIESMAGMAALGVFAYAYRLAQIVLLPVAAFQLAWPAYAFKIRDDGEAARTYARVFERYLTWLGLLAVAVGLAGPWIVRLIAWDRPEYYGAAAVLTPLALGAPLYGAYYIAAVGLGRMKKNRLNWIVIGIAAGVEIALLPILIPRYGAAGAAWAMLIAYGVMLVLIVVRGQRIFPVPYPYGRIAVSVAVVAAGTVASYVISDSGWGSLALRAACWRPSSLRWYDRPRCGTRAGGSGPGAPRRAPSGQVTHRSTCARGRSVRRRSGERSRSEDHRRSPWPRTGAVSQPSPLVAIGRRSGGSFRASRGRLVFALTPCASPHRWPGRGPIRHRRDPGRRRRSRASPWRLDRR